MKKDGPLRLMAIGTVLFMVGLLMAGCGKKGDPIPAHIKPAAAMTTPHRDAERIPISAGQKDYKIMNPREDHYERL